MITETVEPAASRRSLTQERISRRLQVGSWSVDAFFVTPPQDSDASLSRQAVCLAEELAALQRDSDGGSVRLAALMPSGRPVVLVDGMLSDVSVSVSHVHGLVGASLCDTAWVGLDIVDPADAGRGLDLWFTPDELALMPDEHGILRALLWAAKEAAYKAAHLDTEFRPRSVTICELSATAFAWIAHDRFADVRGAGCFFHIKRHIVAVAAASPRQSHSFS
jgi:hypothetical protein